MTENSTSRFDPARNTFEAWNVNFYESKAKTTNAWALAYALLGFWNMNGKGRCNPSVATLLAKTRMKSHNTLLKAIQELEEIGEWAVVRSKGRSSHYYYPLFVKNARTDLIDSGLSEAELAKRELEEQDYEDEQFNAQGQDQGFTTLGEEDPYYGQHSHDDGASTANHSSWQENSNQSNLQLPPMPKSEPSPMEASKQTYNENTSFQVTGIKSLPVMVGMDIQDMSSRVKTPKDFEIKTFYDEMMNDQVLPDSRRTVDLRYCRKMLVLEPGEVKDLNITFDRFDPAGSNTGKYFVAGGQGFLSPEELGPRWVEEFHMNYGPQVFSYSSIDEIYNTFLQEYINRTDWDKQMHLIDAAMYVLGNDAFVPSVSTVKALLFGTKHTTKMAMLKGQVEETIIGRKLTGEYISRGLYTEKGSW